MDQNQPPRRTPSKDPEPRDYLGKFCEELHEFILEKAKEYNFDQAQALGCLQVVNNNLTNQVVRIFTVPPEKGN